MDFRKLRILGSGFTEEEYNLYRFADLDDPHDAMKFLSIRANRYVFRPRVNNSAQLHLLEDKWVTELFFSKLGLPVPGTYGLYHPVFGLTTDGAPLCSAADVLTTIQRSSSNRLVFKPRGGRQGHHIIVAQVDRRADGDIDLTVDGKRLSVDAFVASLPQDAFDDYDGGYHGWLIQPYLEQHPFMLEINPHTVNTFRVITFIDADGRCKIHFVALRLGRKGSSADNWDKGGLSVHVDPVTGMLGPGVFKPAYGGQWLSHHPDTKVELEGRIVPEWGSIVSVCKRAALAVSGIRSIGWDIAYSREGPVILEANAEWSLPLVQVHSRGYLNEDVRHDLQPMGAVFPSRLRGVIPSLLYLAYGQWARSNKIAAVKRKVAQIGENLNGWKY